MIYETKGLTLEQIDERKYSGIFLQVPTPQMGDVRDFCFER